MEVVAIANQKGGCGKTTTAVNLSACLAAKGKKVLLIDLDPQGSATTHLAISNFDNTMYEAMMGDLSLSQIIKPTEIKGLDIIPADKRLGRAEMEIAGKSIARERILKPKVRAQNGFYHHRYAAQPRIPDYKRDGCQRYSPCTHPNRILCDPRAIYDPGFG